MEVHQSLPTHYLHNPYMVKEEQPTSAPSTPPNDEISHIMAHRRTSNGSVSTLSSCSTDHRLYTHNRVLSATSNGIQNGRPLTADRKRPYNCNMCSSRFGSKMELEEHQNSHTGQKPFECNMCKARFNRRSTLWNHKRIHSDDKPFECNVCRMTFKWKNSLKCHKEMHQRKNEITGMENDPNEKTLTYATAAKRRLLESHDASGVATSSADSVHNVGPLITTSSSATKKRTKSSMSAARAVAANSTANAAFNPNTLSTVDTFIHSPLQADGFFANQKALTISDHKELDSLLSTTRLSSMLKEDSMFKTNICDDLSGFGNHNVFETKQDVNLFHANPFMMFGAPQLVSAFPLRTFLNVLRWYPF
ncbi:hypothetical protein AB6A40_001066 [Gnathostoma spinigerum]|uniref:C2H2-type domain-containing protein n=1 Tax=Gnathostoma spinigerum TaxID=75299 RepID=A0ABD6ECD9_9BILA